MGDLDAIPGDPGAIKAAATSLGHLSSDVHGYASAVAKGAETAISDWKGRRATDFKRCVLTVNGEVGELERSLSLAAQALTTYATALEKAQGDVTAANTSVTNAQNSANEQAKGDPANKIDYQRGAAAAADKAEGDGAEAHAAARRAAQILVNAMHELTAAIVPKGTRGDAASIKAGVNATMGNPGTGTISEGKAWSIFAQVDDGVFTRGPKPNSPAFAKWFAGLNPLQRQLYMQGLNSTFPPKDFNPYSTIKPGSIPAWAKKLNAKYGNFSCEPSGFPGENSPGNSYGYFGGGTVLGPGGVPWPIVSPYATDKDGNIIMGETGAVRADGGISTLDGKDPGWHSIYKYTGVNQFGHIDNSTKLITFGENLTGAELKANQVDPGAVRIDENGRPYAGSDVQRIPGPIRVGKYGSAELPVGRNRDALPDYRYESTKAAGNLLLNTETAASETAKLANHAKRRYYIDYQVNDDGRTRAVVHTYTAGPDGSGGTNVGSFGNGFPDGKGSTTQIAYNTRNNKYNGPTSSPAGDSKVHYIGTDSDRPLDTKHPTGDGAFPKN